MKVIGTGATKVGQPPNPEPWPGVEAHVFNPSTWKLEAGGSLRSTYRHSGFQAMQDYIERPCLKNKQRNKNPESNYCFIKEQIQELQGFLEGEDETGIEAV